jgi:aspartate kinase
MQFRKDMDGPRQTLILKFGGASVATPESFSAIADIIIARFLRYGRVVAVVSAMGNMTDQLIALAHEVHPDPPKREMDMLVSVGERISISLLAMALARKGKEAVSFTGSQSGIITSNHHTEALILGVTPWRLLPHLEEGRIVIVAGFQGVSVTKEITTLGRGGSDTSAVALAVALKAERVEFFKDVQGIYDQDPKKNEKARFCPELTHEQTLEFTQCSSRPVLHPRCVRLAAMNHLPLRVLSFDSFDAEDEIGGTWIRSSVPSSFSERVPLYEEVK